MSIPTLIEKIVTMVTTKLITDIYEYLQSYFTTEDISKIKCKKLTKEEIEYIINCYKELKNKGNYMNITKLTELYQHFNIKFNCVRNNNTYYYYINKYK